MSLIERFHCIVLYYVQTSLVPDSAYKIGLGTYLGLGLSNRD